LFDGLAAFKYWAGGLDLNDLEFRHGSYDNDKANRQTIQANHMLSATYPKGSSPSI
jgi:retinol dehydrogenase 12